PLMKRLLDGEARLEDLPPEIRVEGEAFLRLLSRLDRGEVRLSDSVDRRVMAEVRRRAAARGTQSAGRRSWWVTPREVRLAVQPWMIGAALAAAAGIVFMVMRPPTANQLAVTAPRQDSVFVRFELFAPGARSVSLAGSFNGWKAGATPLVRVDGSGLWTVTVPLPPGAAQYGFMVDGQRWVPDPAAPSVDDGFGRRNSLIAVPGEGKTL
ncbi:MAG TPA: isoamylase early set domain-containing protein, partial [Gemmatimonadales bacterium]|nr:isoamylase early set domain-containing protein [Gemmatimonadales bacterium]